MNIRNILSALSVTLLSVNAWAQTNGCNSSYSRFGLGTMNDQSQGATRSMGGVGQGIRSGQKVNMLNPASYSAIDSLSFIFDVGMGVQYGHFEQGGSSVNARNTNLEYVNAGARITKGLGVSFGFVPYSTIGYNFDASSRVGTNYTTSETITSSTTYYGNGGIHQMYIGFGWNPFHNFSIGVNASYIWGDYNHSLAQTFYEGSSSSSDYNSQNAEWSSNIRTYKIDIGVQYPVRITPQDWMTLGATVTLGHDIGTDVEMLRYTSLGDSIESTTKDAFTMPYSVSAGVAWQHQGRITLAADYTYEKWDGCRIPTSKATTDDVTIEVLTNQYMNRHRVNVGAEYIKDPNSRSYGQRIRYRIGAAYSSPYVKVNGLDGPREIRATAGISLPLTNASKSLVNIGVEWLNRSASSSSLITENYVMVHLGLTFNERWFMKWKFN